MAPEQNPPDSTTPTYPPPPPAGYPGYPTSGVPVQGYPVQGYPVQDYPVQDYPAAPAPQPRKRRQGLVFTITVIVLLILIGGAVGVSKALKSSPTAATSTPTPSSSPSASPSPSPSPSPTVFTFTGDLRTLLLPAPKGSHAWREPMTKDGNLTVDEKANEYVDTALAKQNLIGGGFKRGAARQWVASNGTLVQIEILQFISDLSATAWEQNEGEIIYNGDWILSNRGGLNGASVSEFVISTKPDKDGYTYAAALASHGDVMLEVELWMPKTNEASAKALAQQQFDKIATGMA